jgi:hypothetical protein
MVDRQEAYRPSAQRDSSADMGGYNEKETCQQLTNIRRAMAAGFTKRGYPRKALAWMWLAVANLASFSVHDHRSNERPVIVHCKRGKNRSAALACILYSLYNERSWSIDKEAARHEGPAERWTRSTMS